MKNIASLLAYRELNQSTSDRSNRGFEQSVVSRWAEADFLRHSSSEYVEFRPSPRSSIAAAFSPDGRYLASTHGDHTVKVTDVGTGRVIHSLAGHRRTPWVVRFSPVDADIMASGSLDSTAAIWQVSTGQMLHKYDFGKPIASLAFDPSGTMLVVSAGHKVFSWRFTRLAPPVKILKTRRSLRALHFHPMAPHILLTAEVTERRAGTPADGGGAAITAIAAVPPQSQQSQSHHRNAHTEQQQHHNHNHNHRHHHRPQVQVHSQLAVMYHTGGGGGGVRAGGGDGTAGMGEAEEPDPQDAVDDLAAFIAAHNTMAPSQVQQPHGQQSQQGVDQQQQRQQAGAGAGARASEAPVAHNQGGAHWPTGLLRNLLMGVTGIFTGGLGGGGGGGGAAAGAGSGGGSAAGGRGTVDQHAADTLARVLRESGSFTTHGVNATAAAAGGSGGGGGAPSVNPGGGGVARANRHPHPHHANHPGPPGHAVAATATPLTAGRLNVLSPADILRYQSMGGGVRHAIPLVSHLMATTPTHHEAQGGPSVPLSNTHMAPYDLMWGWDHTRHLSEFEIARARDLTLRVAPDLPSAANHDTPCIVTVRLWDFRDPTRELRKELLVLPRVVLCSEMGIHFTSCGRYMVCCVVRERPSEACMKWQAAQLAAARQDTAATRTHAHPPVGPSPVGDEGQGGDDYCDCAYNFEQHDTRAGARAGGLMDEAETTHDAAGAIGLVATVGPGAGSPGSYRSVEMSDAEMRPRGPTECDGDGNDGNCAGERTVGWVGDCGAAAAAEAQEYDDEFLYDTSTQAFGQEPPGNLGSRAAASAGWRGPDGGSDDGDGDSGGPAISALSLQQRWQLQERHPRPRQQQQQQQDHAEGMAEARTEVSRPGKAAWEMEYDSATAVARAKMGFAASAISGVARGGSGDNGDAFEGADGEMHGVRHQGGSRQSTRLGRHNQRHQHQHQQQQRSQQPHTVANNLSNCLNAAGPYGPQLSRGGATAAAVAATGVLGGGRLQPCPQNPYDSQRQHHHQQQTQQQQQQAEQYQTRGHQQSHPPHAPGRGAEGHQLHPEALRAYAGLSRIDRPPPRGTVAAAVTAWPYVGIGTYGGEHAELYDAFRPETASVGPPTGAQETPSTFASIKAHLALQRSRDHHGAVAVVAGGAPMYAGGDSRDVARAGGTVAGPEAQYAAVATAPMGTVAGFMRTATTATTFGAPAVATAGGGGGTDNLDEGPTVSPEMEATVDGGGGGPAATAAAAADPSSAFRPCYELCIFYTGTSPIPPTLPPPGDPSTANIVTTNPATAAAAPSASSSVAFPMALGLARPPAAVTTMAAAGNGSDIMVAGTSPCATSSAIGPHFGALLHARPVLAAHCMTSVQFSPAGDHVLVAYGRRHISLCSLVACEGQLAAVHSVVEMYSVPDLALRRVLLSADDEVNVAVFNAFPAEGMAYGTKEGRLRLIRYDRRPPLRSAIPFVSPPPPTDDELWEAEHQEQHQQNGGGSMSMYISDDGEQEGVVAV